MPKQTLDQVPSLLPLYARAAVSALAGGDGLPDTTLAVEGVTVDRRHLADYVRLCGFRLRDVLPPTYPHLLAFPLSVQLMASRKFPFALPGLVHIANRITLHRTIRSEDLLTVEVATRDLRPHPKGRQFDVIATVRVDGDVVWDESSTYLHREQGGDRDAPTPGPDLDPVPDGVEARWRVPADTGRRYAAVSGDRNPIHLSALTARPFGFPRAIAHGMWTAARALAALDGRTDDVGTYDVAFRKPVRLPSTVTFSSRDDKGQLAFAVHGGDGRQLHLVGTYEPGQGAP